MRERDARLVPCHLCGSLELPEGLEPAPERCARERVVCADCAQRLDDEERAEALEDEFNNRQFVDEESLRLVR